MEAIIVAGGLGTRLRPLTVNAPKHLLPVAGIPFVGHQLAKLAEAGVARVLLATSYHADQFEPELGDGRAWGVELVYATEEQPLGTGGAIRNVASRLESAADEPIVILNGDILSGHDLPAQVQHHREAGADVTLHLVEVADARAYGCVPTEDGRVTAFHEKSPDPVSRQINAGCYVFRRAVVDKIPPDRVVSVERETFPGLVAAGAMVLGYVDRRYWVDVGTPATLCRASSDVVRGIASSAAFRAVPGELFMASDASLAVGASASGGSSLGSGSFVDVDTVVEGSLIARGAKVGAGSHLVNSVIGPGAQVGSGVVLRDAVVGDHAVVGDGCELLAGARVWVGAHIPPGAVRFSSDM
ncbi:MAG: NDP-sugar synthase [Nocardioidaceae bacterium]|nr:NDP-sugar synthase [Nocardioidaceae bacterium]